MGKKQIEEKEIEESQRAILFFAAPVLKELGEEGYNFHNCPDECMMR